MPEDYGAIALITVFIAIASVIIDTGFSSALIQRKDVDEVEYSSVFFASIFMSIALYFAIYIASPYISNYYSEPVLKWVLRVQALTIVIAGFSSVQYSILVRNLLFKKLFKYRMLGIALQGAIGITLAVLGFGVWALVIPNLVNSAVITIPLWMIIEWKPKLLFSYAKLKNLFSFSSKILAISLISNIFNNIKSLIIGKSFSPTTLGYYNRGYQIPNLIMINTDGAISAVMFPVLSKCQNDRTRLLSIYKRSIRTSVFIAFPLMLGLFAVSESLTILLLTEKWLPSVPFLRLTCLICMTWPFSIAYQLFNSQGYSGTSLRLNITAKIIDVILMVFSIRYGVYAFVFSALISSLISILINFVVVQKFFEYKVLEQLKDVMPSLILSVLMGILVYSVRNITDTIILNFMIQVVIGIIFYVGSANIFKMEIYLYLRDSITSIIKNRKVSSNV